MMISELNKAKGIASDPSNVKEKIKETEADIERLTDGINELLGPDERAPSRSRIQSAPVPGAAAPGTNQIRILSVTRE